MSVLSFLKSRCHVYRPTESVGTYSEKKNTYTARTANGATLVQKVAIAVPQFNRTDEGAGDASRGTVEGYMMPGADIADEDVIDIITGPDSPRKLRVLSHSKPGGALTHLMLEPFNGNLT